MSGMEGYVSDPWLAGWRGYWGTWAGMHSLLRCPGGNCPGGCGPGARDQLIRLVEGYVGEEMHALVDKAKERRRGL